MDLRGTHIQKLGLQGKTHTHTQRREVQKNIDKVGEVKHSKLVD